MGSDPQQDAAQDDIERDDISIATENAVTPQESFLPNPLDNTTTATSQNDTAAIRQSWQAPLPDTTYMIRRLSSSDFLTLHHGSVILAPTGVLGSQYWECVRSQGWLGFRNVASHDFLGRDGSWTLCCGASVQREWEKFHVVSRQEGGFVMLMTHWGKLRPVDFGDEEGGRMAMVEVTGDNGIAWEFVKVADSTVAMS